MLPFGIPFQMNPSVLGVQLNLFNIDGNQDSHRNNNNENAQVIRTLEVFCIAVSTFPYIALHIGMQNFHYGGCQARWDLKILFPP